MVIMYLSACAAMSGIPRLAGLHKLQNYQVRIGRVRSRQKTHLYMPSYLLPTLSMNLGTAFFMDW